MANRHRGEIDAEIGGRRRTLCLTLGALAELEDRFGAADLGALADRFAGGRLRAADAAAVIAAGLRGAGEAVSEADVATMPAAGGAAGYAAIVVRLLQATFGTAAPDGEGGTSPGEPLHPSQPRPATPGADGVSTAARR
ncbi:gene transfer agent family protein [Methylobrevis albus]|uniref:Gene transfer agent family protein n=1 Tax=Methylobrevis albus TaxID=2793297 RepID=A0A931MXT5_9HYPH|nr:gene transfer agent family protein [Methylobrevis albus]MBH0237607.1 gene transfer agent family protein [Methylobrevis albus]